MHTLVTGSAEVRHGHMEVAKKLRERGGEIGFDEMTPWGIGFALVLVWACSVLCGKVMDSIGLPSLGQKP